MHENLFYIFVGLFCFSSQVLWVMPKRIIQPFNLQRYRVLNVPQTPVKRSLNALYKRLNRWRTRFKHLVNQIQSGRQFDAKKIASHYRIPD